MTLDELKAEISERIESEQDKLDSLNNRKKSKGQKLLHKRGNVDCISNCFRLL